MKLLFTTLIMTSFMGLGVKADDTMEPPAAPAGMEAQNDMQPEHREPAKSKKHTGKKHSSTSKKHKKSKKHKTT